MLNLNQFKEKIDTEFPGNSSVLPIQAIKTDASSASLKEELYLNCIKTCDYIRFKGKSTLILIECSDLDRQRVHLEQDLLNLLDKCSGIEDKELKKLANKVRNKYRASVDKIIFDELKVKYKDSLLLVNKLADKKGLDFTKRFKNKEFFVVTNKLANPKPSDSIALDQFRRALTSDLKTGLSCIVDEVRVLEPQKLVGFFKNS